MSNRKRGKEAFVDELARALVAPSGIYSDARKNYERLRATIIEQLGYDVFRHKQRKAFRRALGAS